MDIKNIKGAFGMKLGKKIKVWVITGVLVLGSAAAVYGYAYHNGYEAGIEKNIVLTYLK